MSEDPGRYAGRYPQGGKPKGMPIAQAMDLLNNVRNWGALAAGIEAEGTIPTPPGTPLDRLCYAYQTLVKAGRKPPVSEALIASCVLAREGRVGGSLRTRNASGQVVTLSLNAGDAR